MASRRRSPNVAARRSPNANKTLFTFILRLVFFFSMPKREKNAPSVFKTWSAREMSAKRVKAQTFSKRFLRLVCVWRAAGKKTAKRSERFFYVCFFCSFFILKTCFSRFFDVFWSIFRFFSVNYVFFTFSLRFLLNPAENHQT